MGGLLHLVQQRRGDWAEPQPAQAPSRCTKCNSPLINGQCTSHRMLYNGPFLYGFNVPIKGLNINEILVYEGARPWIADSNIYFL